LVEAVEAFTIVLAVGTIRGWRPAIAGTALGLLVLAAIVALLGAALDHLPIVWLQLAIGILLIMFGLRWLRRAVLRYAGLIPLHDENEVFGATTAELTTRTSRRRNRLDWIGATTAFNAVLLEGIEIVFIVFAVGAGHGLIGAAALGAGAAGVLVLAAGCAVHRPLARVPENALKFCVGVLLSAFGVFWTGEGLGIPWPGGDWALVGFTLVFLLAGVLAARMARRAIREAVA
jgi:uncharacterized membrane protein